MPATQRRISDFVSKTRARARSRGLGEVAASWGAAARATVWSSTRIIVLRRRATGEDPAPAEFIVRWAERDDGDAYARCFGTDSASSFSARLTPGNLCLLVEHERRLVHASWVTTAGARMGEARRYFVPPPGDAYIYESFTRSEARGKGIYPLALRWISDDLSRRGVRHLWIAAEETNRPSMRAITKAGFDAVARVDIRRRAGAIKVVCSPLAGGSAEDCWPLAESLPE